MIDACTRCGKCVDICPVTGPAGVGDATPKAVIAGVLDIVRLGDGSPAAQAWAKGCALTGDCIEACPEGVNPRFLLAMARVAMARKQDEPRERRKKGVENFRLVADGANVLSRMQLDDADLARLGQRVGERLHSGSTAKPGERPDFVFYTGCNVLKTPHIALLALDIMDALGVTYNVMGGPSHCCGIVQARTGDIEVSGRLASNSLDKTGAREGRRHFLVRKLSRAIHRDDTADDRESARRAAVRDDAVHAVPADALCRLAAAAHARVADARSRCTSIRASRAWSKPAPRCCAWCRAWRSSTCISRRSA